MGGLHSDNGKENGNYYSGFRVRLKQIEYGAYGDLIVIYPNPYSIYFRGTIGRCGLEGMYRL